MTVLRRFLLVFLFAFMATSIFFAVLTATADARLPHADDGGSGVTQVGDECWMPGAVTTGVNPQTGRNVVLLCECSPGGTRCLWVQISYRLHVRPE